ncbi:hypothetical protein FQA39_LY14794 [Lamprigera yunnana]|nr:hypothetical protein FQA39_LY14794 [Lamprigera yunnana]
MSDRRADKTQTATPANTHAKVKCEAEPEPSQRVTEFTQLNAYTTAASEVTTDKLDTTAETDNDSSTAATVALPTTRAAEDEVYDKEESPADFKNEESLANKHDANVHKTQGEELEQSTAAAEEEDRIPESQAGEQEKQVLPTAQCDLRLTKSEGRTRMVGRQSPPTKPR